GKFIKDTFLLGFANPFLNDFFETCEHIFLYYNPGFDFNINSLNDFIGCYAVVFEIASNYHLTLAAPLDMSR
ncbi:MAG: hypothetical protein QNK29_08745, partial [Desulfobacterales bacterium]|nr:hypothetical protein [Desulfobacterales bacterium]MDX2512023.1 hypothetical protein [Desulfobacterales bacterium]